MFKFTFESSDPESIFTEVTICGPFVTCHFRAEDIADSNELKEAVEAVVAKINMPSGAAADASEQASVHVFFDGGAFHQSMSDEDDVSANAVHFYVGENVATGAVLETFMNQFQLENGSGHVFFSDTDALAINRSFAEFVSAQDLSYFQYCVSANFYFCGAVLNIIQGVEDPDQTDICIPAVAAGMRQIISQPDAEQILPQLITLLRDKMGVFEGLHKDLEALKDADPAERGALAQSFNERLEELRGTLGDGFGGDDPEFKRDAMKFLMHSSLSLLLDDMQAFIQEGAGLGSAAHADDGVALDAAAGAADPALFGVRFSMGDLRAMMYAMHQVKEAEEDPNSAAAGVMHGFGRQHNVFAEAARRRDGGSESSSDDEAFEGGAAAERGFRGN